MGIEVVRLAVEKDKKLIDGWQLTFHHLPAAPWRVGYFPKGPAPTKQMLESLTKLGREKRAIFIQLEPNVQCNNITIKQFNNLSLKPSHRPLFTKYTFMLDLTLPEEELLRNMHPKTRYNLKVAQRHGVIVKEDNSPQVFEAYLALTRETTGRQRFYAHNEDYHRKMWEIMRQAGIAHLFTASYQGSTLAAWIVFVWKDTVYYPYGASGKEHREVMAPTLILWEIARWAKAKGLTYFDLWGALGPHPDEKDPWYGFHRFKQGFAPALVEFVGSYDLIINRLLYRFYTMADTLRWMFLRIKTKLHTQ